MMILKVPSESDWYKVLINEGGKVNSLNTEYSKRRLY